MQTSTTVPPCRGSRRPGSSVAAYQNETPPLRAAPVEDCALLVPGRCTTPSPGSGKRPRDATPTGLATCVAPRLLPVARRGGDRVELCEQAAKLTELSGTELSFPF